MAPSAYPQTEPPLFLHPIIISSLCLRSYVIALLIPPNLEVPSDSSSGMMSDGDGDGDGDCPCLVGGYGDDTLMVDPFLCWGLYPLGLHKQRKH